MVPELGTNSLSCNMQWARFLAFPLLHIKLSSRSALASSSLLAGANKVNNTTAPTTWPGLLTMQALTCLGSRLCRIFFVVLATSLVGKQIAAIAAITRNHRNHRNHKASLDTPSSSTFTNYRFGPPPRSEIRPCLRIHHWHTLASKSLRPRALAGLAGLTGLAGFSLVSLVAGRTQSQILFPDHPVPPSTRISLDTASPTELAP